MEFTNLSADRDLLDWLENQRRCEPPYGVCFVVVVIVGVVLLIWRNASLQ